MTEMRTSPSSPKALRPGHAAFPVSRRQGAPFQIHDNLFKYHAACYMTHSAIEACKGLRTGHGLEAGDIARVRLRVAPGHLKVCNIPEPETGLEVKFSLRHTAAMALSGVDTGATGNYSDEIAERADLVALRRLVEVDPRPGGTSTMTTAAEVIAETCDGVTLTNGFDVGIPATDTDAQEARLAAKFDALVGPILGPERTASLRQRTLSGDPTPGALMSATQP